MLNRPHRILLLFLIALLLPTGVAVFIYGRWLLSDRVDEKHYALDETEVIVTNLDSARFVIVRCGGVPSDTAVVGDADRVWLAAGNYYVLATGSHGPAYYPVPLTGYRSGPDAGGRFAVTLRPPPEHHPPLPLSNMLFFRYIPSGSFLVGDRQNPREPHYVWQTGYHIAPFEVTNLEFRRFVETTGGYQDDANWTEAGRQWKSANPLRATSALQESDRDYVRFGQEDQPVTLVSWFEANAYCRWLTRTIGRGRWQYALPTDAEWEKAARGPENFDYSAGATISDNAIALYNWKKNPISDETVVGIAVTLIRYRPNRYGLFHMTGNVAEWAQSEYRAYDRNAPYTDDDRNHDEGNARRSVRGGSWYSATNASLSTPYRDAFQPGHRTQELGFRVVARLLP